MNCSITYGLWQQISSQTPKLMTLAEKGIGFLGVRLKKFLIHCFYIIIYRLSVAEFSTFLLGMTKKPLTLVNCTF